MDEQERRDDDSPAVRRARLKARRRSRKLDPNRMRVSGRSVFLIQRLAAERGPRAARGGPPPPPRAAPPRPKAAPKGGARRRPRFFPPRRPPPGGGRPPPPQAGARSGRGAVTAAPDLASLEATVRDFATRLEGY